MIRISLVDDHKLFLLGIKTILSEVSDFEVVAESQSGEEALGKFQTESDWDVLVVDMSLPDISGIELIRRVRKKNSTLPILVLSMHNEEQYGCLSLRSGASGYLTKDSAPEELEEAIRRVVSGRKYVSPQLADRVVDTLHHGAEEPSISKLSRREMQVLLELGAGHGLGDIAERLGVNVKTVSTYRARILEKLNLSTTADLIHHCYQNGLVDAVNRAPSV